MIFKISMMRTKGDRAQQRRQSLNSPTLAYKTVYGKMPPTFLSGRTPHDQKLWQGIPVDKELKDRWLKELNNLSRVQIRSSCYDEKTEVYTNEGFQKFSEVNDGKVLTLNPETKELEWSAISSVVSYPFEGELFHFTNKTTDLMVTPDHQMIYTTTGEVEKTDFEDCRIFSAIPEKMHRSAILIKKASWSGYDKETIKIFGVEYDTKAFARFLGWYLAEGCIKTRENKKTGHKCYSIVISQFNPKNRKIIKKDIIALLGKTPNGGKKGFEICTKEIQSLAKYLLTLGTCVEKRVPNEIKQLSPKYIIEFLETFGLGDGHTSPEHIWKEYKFAGTRTFTTASKQLASDLGELLIKVGRWPTYCIGSKKGDKQQFSNGTYTLNHDVYQIRDTRGKYTWVYNKEKVPYKGMVYDLTAVKNHIILVRRNGKVIWSSNCAGHGENRPTFVVFRLQPASIEKSEKVVQSLNKFPNIRASMDIGRENLPRICVATKSWYGKDDWEDWWENLASRIKKSTQLEKSALDLITRLAKKSVYKKLIEYLGNELTQD